MLENRNSQHRQALGYKALRRLLCRKGQDWDIIEEYNKIHETDGKSIEYTDYVGILMSSISKIINFVSYALIAFVSISLLVSSIMIGIITYTSVLERTKEIGILRAIGASKRDISRVFNAETLIMGFGAGITVLLTQHTLKSYNRLANGYLQYRLTAGGGRGNPCADFNWINPYRGDYPLKDGFQKRPGGGITHRINKKRTCKGAFSLLIYNQSITIPDFSAFSRVSLSHTELWTSPIWAFPKSSMESLD